MSIALSIDVQPSKRLYWALIAMLLLANVSVYLALLEFKFTVLPLLFALLSSIIASFTLAWRFHQQQITYRIEISNTGQIILRLWSIALKPSRSEVVSLLPDSLIWPQLMLLHFRQPEGKIITVRILNDSASVEALRRLRVALLWVAKSQRSSKQNGNFLEPF
jgi:hypothetical protein